jgi:hypothetical protein
MKVRRYQGNKRWKPFLSSQWYHRHDRKAAVAEKKTGEDDNAREKTIVAPRPVFDQTHFGAVVGELRLHGGNYR